MPTDVLRLADLGAAATAALLARLGLDLRTCDPRQPIPGSYWGEPEAGIIGASVYVHDDTPVHSLLHETCHVICMSPDRRECLDRDAGGDDLEEAAVCYLQILLADCMTGVGRNRLMQDMDAWGYSFRLGSAARWFEEDAGDALAWLQDLGLISADGKPNFRLRE